MRLVARGARWGRAAKRTNGWAPKGQELADTRACGRPRPAPLTRWELAL